MSRKNEGIAHISILVAVPIVVGVAMFSKSILLTLTVVVAIAGLAWGFIRWRNKA